ncbi:MAG TPA: hypothetical protein VNN08_24755 [Thermoanaerobaculia bacterium]|nr:hypothetical protein [Thermoanaerobaculia bacterium]
MSKFEVFEISDRNPYLAGFRTWLDGFEPNLWERLEELESLPAETQLQVLVGSLELACLTQHIGNITLGRFVLQRRLPREWVVRHISSAAESILADLDQEWVFRRLAELYSTLDAELLRQLVTRGEEHPDPDVREAAREFRV